MAITTEQFIENIMSLVANEIEYTRSDIDHAECVADKLAK